ncbi:Dolichyl-diphosphooligosaccharide--protein glycosyltransferase subunit 1A, partial [Nymphaea thermarum]
VQAALQNVHNIISRCIAVEEKLGASLHELSRTGDVQACKTARKAADGLLKELLKELKPTLAFLQSSSQGSQIWPKVDELVAKEKEKQERLMMKHSTVVDGYEKRSNGRDIANRVVAHDQRLAVLNQEVDELLDFIDQI